MGHSLHSRRAMATRASSLSRWGLGPHTSIISRLCESPSAAGFPIRGERLHPPRRRDAPHPVVPQKSDVPWAALKLGGNTPGEVAHLHNSILSISLSRASILRAVSATQASSGSIANSLAFSSLSRSGHDSAVSAKPPMYTHGRHRCPAGPQTVLAKLPTRNAQGASRHCVVRNDQTLHHGRHGCPQQELATKRRRPPYCTRNPMSKETTAHFSRARRDN